MQRFKSTLLEAHPLSPSLVQSDPLYSDELHSCSEQMCGYLSNSNYTRKK